MTSEERLLMEDQFKQRLEILTERCDSLERKLEQSENQKTDTKHTEKKIKAYIDRKITEITKSQTNLEEKVFEILKSQEHELKTMVQNLIQHGVQTAISKVIEDEKIQTHLIKHLDGPICTKIKESIESIEKNLGANMEKNIKKQIQSCFEGGFKNVLLQTSEIIKSNVTQNLALTFNSRFAAVEQLLTPVLALLAQAQNNSTKPSNSFSPSASKKDHRDEQRSRRKRKRDESNMISQVHHDHSSSSSFSNGGGSNSRSSRGHHHHSSTTSSSSAHHKKFTDNGPSNKNYHHNSSIHRYHRHNSNNPNVGVSNHYKPGEKLLFNPKTNINPYANSIKNLSLTDFTHGNEERKKIRKIRRNFRDSPKTTNSSTKEKTQDDGVEKEMKEKNAAATTASREEKIKKVVAIK